MTAQINDFIECDGQKMRLISDIPLPRRHARIRKSDRSITGGALIFSTACWRRHIAFWRIYEGKLYLRGFAGRYELTEGGPLLVDWFSGDIHLTTSWAETYAHERYVTRVEREIVLEVEHGIVIRVLGPQLV